MTDYAEEQLHELEALKSIFFDEFSEPEVPTTPASFSLHIKLDDYYGPQPEPEYTLKVTYTPEYPETLPTLQIANAVSLDPEEIEKLSGLLVENAESQLGMAMIFGVHAWAKESLETHVRDRIEREEREREERILAEEEAERQRHAGTKVTAESFAEWRTRFVKETEEDEKKKALEKLGGANSAGAKAAARAEANRGKFTGKALFEKDKTLANSDAALMGADDIDVDAHEFDGLEDGEDEEEEEEVNAVLANFSDDDD
ncbi:UNVERIFIED_CONTAM: RWD domain-containing protein 1 [Siphonaria sp. JEL0065]|nr:RWD domain-containing protein 1 [Siphonaria sp. JEL0065]